MTSASRSHSQMNRANQREDRLQDGLECKVVGLRTDNFNFASQRAIEALGVKRDGVIRHHAPRRDGTVRDTV